MAKVISGFTGRKFKYDWKRWMDGSIYRVTQGQDFDCRPEGFRNTLYSRAFQSTKPRKRVRVSIQGKDVEFQFLPRGK